MTMKVHLGDAWRGSFAPFNIAGVNPGVELEKVGGVSSRPKKAEDGDRVIISSQARLGGLLDSMTKQKQRIADHKRALVSWTLEKGGTLDSIRIELENYDQMVRDIDAQMADILAQEIREQAEKPQPERDDEKPKTLEEAQSERLADITTTSADLQQAGTLHALKKDAEGKLRVLASEAALDRGRGASAADAATRLNDAEQKVEDLAAQLADKLGDVNERLEPGDPRHAKSVDGRRGLALPADEAADSDKALQGLNEAHPKLNVMAGGVNPGMRSDRYPEKLDVMIAPNVLKKMAMDPAAAERYERMLSDAPKYVKWADAMTRAITGNEVKYRQVWIDEKGNMGAFNAFGPSNRRLRTDEAIRKKDDEAFQEKMEKAWEERLEFEKWIQDEDGKFSVEKMGEIDINRLLNLTLL